MSRPTLLLLCAAGLFGSTAIGAELNSLSDLRVLSTPTGTQVVVSGTRPPTFTVFRLSAPDRLVVDLSSADASAIKGHHEGTGPVSGVVASQFSDEKSSVGRVMLALAPAAQYDVKADGAKVVISVREGSAAAPAPAKAEEVATAPAAQAQAPAQPTSDVVTARVDEQPVARPAKRLTQLTFSKNALRVVADGQLAKFELIELSNPPRLALDLYDVKAGGVKAPRVAGALKEVRVGGHSDKVRLVLDVNGPMPKYRAARTANGLKLTLDAAASDAKPAAPVVAQAESASAEPQDAEVEIDGKRVTLEGVEVAPLVVKREEKAPRAEVKDLRFEESTQGGRVELKLSGLTRFKVERPDANSAVLTLEPAQLPKRLERSLDTSALETPIKMISAFSVPGTTDKVRVVVAGSGALEEKVTQTASGLSWRLSTKGVKAEEVAVGGKVSGFSTEATRYAEAGAPQRRYVGKKVSFEFKDIDIHNLLRIIAEVSKKNIVVADDVGGKVTIRLRNVPWDQALELILRSKSLGKEDLGNIIRVAPLKTLEEEAKLRAERRKAQIVQEELQVQLIPINYATAGEMSSRVKEVLSERGSVTVDTRTNVLIVRDIASTIGRARQLVQSLDTQTPQVLIESRIVEANTSFSRQIGVQWGGQSQMAPGTGNPTGLVFPNTVAVRGGSSPESNQGTSADPNFAVNLPAAVGQGSGGALGFIFGSAGGALALNLRLSALENQGVVKTISAPKVTTLDNNAARISQGVSIPFSQVSSSGVNTAFVEARLSLEVTPHITQDGSILMSIRAENNQPDPANTGANGQPAIQKKEANTQVLVKDGDTTVIGGIYVRRGSSTSNMVPFFGKIPILGFFFRNNNELENRQELLIFITPRIINRQPLAQNL